MDKIITLGAGGHAKEVMDILVRDYLVIDMHFFDNINHDKNYLFNKFKILHSAEELITYDSFYLGVGGIDARRKLSCLGLQFFLCWQGIRSQLARIGQYCMDVHTTVDIMDGVQISSNVSIGKGTLINRNVNIHHDVSIGSFCEIAPSAIILGGVRIRDNVFIGSGAIILPKLSIGSNVIIGAGALVVNDVPSGKTVMGVPAKEKIEKNSKSDFYQ